MIDPINSPELFLASEFARSNRCVLFRIAHEMIFCDSNLWMKQHAISFRAFFVLVGLLGLKQSLVSLYPAATTCMLTVDR